MSETGQSLRRLLDAVRSSGVSFALIGAAAQNTWAPPRLTTDLDLAVIADESGYRRIVESLARLGYRPARAHRGDPAEPVPLVTIFRNEDEEPPYRQVDVLVAGTDFEREAIEQAVERRVADFVVPVVSREHLVVYKLISWRRRDRQDIADVLATARAAGAILDLGRVRQWAEAWEVVDRLERALAESDEP